MGADQPEFLTTLADIYFSAGEPRRAVAAQQRAIELAETEGWSEGFLRWLQNRLSRYSAALREHRPTSRRERLRRPVSMKGSEP